MRLLPVAALALGTLAACGPTTPDTGAQPPDQPVATSADTAAAAPAGTATASQASQPAESATPSGPSGQLTATTSDGEKVSAAFSFSDLMRPSAAGDALSACGGLDTSRVTSLGTGCDPTKQRLHSQFVDM